MALLQLAPRVATRRTAEDYGPTLALFDLDRTLIRGSSVVALGRAMARDGMVGRRKLAMAALLEARYRRQGASDATADRACDRALQAVAGVERSSLWELVRRVGTELAGSVPAEARMLLDHHLAAGHFCVLLSASPQELVEAVADSVGAQCAIGTRGAADHGRLTGQVDGTFCYGPGKLVRLRESLGAVNMRTAWAYADSRSDIPLLETCGNPVAVNPDRHLRRLARARGWPVIPFS